MSETRRERATEAFFGRRHGKSLSASQTQSMEDVLPRLRLGLEKPGPANLREIFPEAVDSIWMEIGFGGGEHLLHRAHERPSRGFIGVEPFVNGMAKMVAALQAEPRDNIRLYDDDATRLLDWLPPASLDGLDLLYPDPWPKKKHFKRRFVSRRNLDRFARILKPGASFRFASDIDTYVNWTLQHIAAHEAYAWDATSADDWRTPYAGWPGTRYEAKALREGRVPTYLTFRRI